MTIDRPVLPAVRTLNRKHITTFSSEGGGDPSHGAPNFAYIEARLTEDNREVCRSIGCLLRRVFGGTDDSVRLFFGSTRIYHALTGNTILGLCRRGLTDQDVENIFEIICSRLSPQG